MRSGYGHSFHFDWSAGATRPLVRYPLMMARMLIPYTRGWAVSGTIRMDVRGKERFGVQTHLR